MQCKATMKHLNSLHLFVNLLMKSMRNNKLFPRTLIMCFVGIVKYIFLYTSTKWAKLTVGFGIIIVIKYWFVLTNLVPDQKVKQQGINVE